MKRAAEIARAANRDAARVLREEERQRLPHTAKHTAADDALRQEEGEDAAAEEGTDDSDADRREEALGAEPDKAGQTCGDRGRQTLSIRALVAPPWAHHVLARLLLCPVRMVGIRARLSSAARLLRARGSLMLRMPVPPG